MRVIINGDQFVILFEEMAALPLAVEGITSSIKKQGSIGKANANH